MPGETIERAAIKKQMQPAKASVYFYRVTFKPTVIIPDINIRTP